MVNEVGKICIAVYRPDWELLRNQLNSIQEQSLSNWTATIGIDGRDDDLKFKIEELVGFDTRFTVRAYSERVGHYRNFERLLEDAGREGYQWIAFADQDDYWYPEKLERMVPYLNDYDLVCSQARIVAVDGVSRKVLGETNRADSSLAALFIDNRVTGSFSVISPRVLQVALPFPRGTDQAFHDHWLAVCAKSSSGLKFIEDVLQDYNQHNSNVIGEQTADSLRTRLARLRSRTGSSGLKATLGYLAEHRWGWRVNMARCLEQRTECATQTIRTFARGRFSGSLVRIVGREMVRRTVPALRGVGLLVGSLAVRDGGVRS